MQEMYEVEKVVCEKCGRECFIDEMTCSDYGDLCNGCYQYMRKNHPMTGWYYLDA